MSKTDLENRKLEAEIAKLEAETIQAQAEAEVSKAQARRELAEARQAEHDAKSRKINLEAKQREELLTKTGDFFHHQYFFSGQVGDSSVKACLTTLSTWDRLDPECPMEIVINSPGGSVIAGMHLFDQLSSYSLLGGGGHEITITVRGYAASMAGILLQAADIRRIGPESYLMIHEVASVSQGKIGELKDEVKFLDRVSERIADIFVSRSGGKITLKKFKEGWNRQDWWLDSEESLRLGFVDEIA